MTYNIKLVQRKQDTYVWIVFIIVCFFFVALCISLVRLTGQYYTQKQYLRKQETALKQAREENNKLRTRIAYTKTDSYIEEEARRRALGKPNEYVIVGTFPTPTPPPTTPPPKSPYQQWLGVYFGS